MNLLFSNKKPAGPATIDVAGTVLKVSFRRNAKARRLILRFDKSGDGLVVTLPPGTQERDGLAFAAKQAGWIARRLEKRPEPVPFTDGATVPVRGARHEIRHRPDRRGTVWVEGDGTGAPLICVAGEDAHLARRVRDWLKREARTELRARSAYYAQVMGLTYKRVDIRDQTSRWGSCSSSGVLSYSWRLILAPVHVLDYVAAHEVAHLKEMNHSARFWTLVEDALPTMQRSRKWLKEHGAGLHRYGAE